MATHRYRFVGFLMSNRSVGKNESQVGNLMVKLEKREAKLESGYSMHVNVGCHPQKRILAIAKIRNKGFKRLGPELNLWFIK